MLLRMFNNFFKNTVYVRVLPNRFELKHIESGNKVTAVPSIAFTTKRLLVGQFTVAEDTLRKGLNELLGRHLFNPRILIQPVDMIEGGLSEVEERVLRELAVGIGAIKTKIWTGRELTDQQVLNKIDNN